MKMSTTKNVINEAMENTDFYLHSVVLGHDGMAIVGLQGDNPCGEDWYFEVSIPIPATKKKLIENLYSAIYNEYNNYDVDEEVSLWVEAKANGVAGVPHMEELVRNEKCKQASLKKLAEKLSKFELRKGAKKGEEKEFLITATRYGYCTIDAETESEAFEKAEDLIESDFDWGEVDPHEYQVQDAEEE